MFPHMCSDLLSLLHIFLKLYNFSDFPSSADGHWRELPENLLSAFPLACCTASKRVCAFILLCGFLWKCYLIQHFPQTVNETSARKVLTLYLSSCYTLYKCSTLRSLTELKPLPHGTASLFVSFRWMPSYCSVHMCWLRGGPRRYGAHIPAQGRPDLKSPASIEIHSSAARFNLFRSSPPKNKNN